MQGNALFKAEVLNRSASMRPHDAGAMRIVHVEVGLICLGKSGQVTEYPVVKADPNVRGPHTPIFDRQKANLWFTMQSGHVGRLNPATGEMKIAAAPSNKPGAPTYPYGIRVNTISAGPWPCRS